MFTVVTRSEVPEKDQVRFFGWNWREEKSGILTFAGPAAMKVSDVKPQETFEVVQGEGRELDKVKFFKGTVKIKMATMPGEIPSLMYSRPEGLPPATRSGDVVYVNLVGKFHQMTQEKSKTYGDKTIRYRSLCLQTFTETVRGLDAFAWVDVEASCKFYRQLEGFLTRGASVLISEVKCKTYDASTGLRQQLSMTMFSQVVPNKAPEQADGILSQSEEIYQVFKSASSSPSRRRALKRLLSEAEKPETCRKEVARRLDKLKVKGVGEADEEAADAEAANEKAAEKSAEQGEDQEEAEAEEAEEEEADEGGEGEDQEKAAEAGE